MQALDFQINPKLKELFYKQSIDRVMGVDRGDFWGWSGFSGSCVDSFAPSLPVHSPACSDAPEWCWLTLVHITCSRQHPGLCKREKLWLHGFKQKWYFCFSTCMPCAAGEYRGSCADSSVGVCREPLSLFTLLHTPGHQTLSHSFSAGDGFSFECSAAGVPLV